MLAKSLQSCLTLCDPMAPLSMGFSRQEYWNGLLCPAPGDLPNTGIKLPSLMSPALAGRFFTTTKHHFGSPKKQYKLLKVSSLKLDP